MGTTKVSPRDFGYFLLGAIISALLTMLFLPGVLFNRQVLAAGSWLKDNNAIEIEDRCGVHLNSYTGKLGLMVIFSPGRYSEKSLGEISVWLIKKHCPYSIVVVIENKSPSVAQ